MVAGRRPKIFDFGLAKIPVLDSVRHTAFDPATGPFLPPESLTGSYSYKFDCFSLGMIAIQICTLQMPEPTPPYVVVTAGKHERVPEDVQRRVHIQMIPLKHPLRSIALECLKDENKRLSSTDLCGLINALKGEAMYYIERAQKLLSQPVTLQRQVEMLQRHNIFNAQIMPLQACTQPFSKGGYMGAWLGQVCCGH